MTDFSAIGRECLKAGEVLGINSKSRSVSDRITSIYLEGLQSGRYRPAIVLPYGCFPTAAPGDHPLDHRFSKASHVAPQYRDQIRRASGLIAGEWPDGIDLSWEEQEEQRRRPKPNPFAIHTIATAPDVSWVFNP
jgi:hypothetical protein